MHFEFLDSHLVECSINFQLMKANENNSITVATDFHKGVWWILKWQKINKNKHLQHIPAQ